MTTPYFSRMLIIIASLCLTSCAMVGPDYAPPAVNGRQAGTGSSIYTRKRRLP